MFSHHRRLGLYLMLSHVPWDGPIGAVRIGLVDGEIIINPTNEQLEVSELDMVLAGTADAIMVEGEANQLPEETLVAAILKGHAEIRRIAEIQNGIAGAGGQAEVGIQRASEECRTYRGAQIISRDTAHGCRDES